MGVLELTNISKRLQKLFDYALKFLRAGHERSDFRVPASVVAVEHEVLRDATGSVIETFQGIEV